MCNTKKTKNTQLLQNKFKVLAYIAACFDLSSLDKHGSSYREQNYMYIENDLKGNENCFELVGGLSYRGFELPIIKVQEIDFDSS